MKSLLIVIIALLAGFNAVALNYAKETAGKTNVCSESKPTVNYIINLPENISPGNEYIAEVVFSFDEGWHGYSDDRANAAMGFIPTKVDFVFPDGVKAGDIVPSSGSMIYEGDVSFSLKFIYLRKAARKKKTLPVTIKLQWQVCDENMCLPPENLIIEKLIKVK